MRKRRSLPKRLLSLSVVLFIALALAAWLLTRASLPQLAGEFAAPGLAGKVTIERDALGTATIRADNRKDAAYALGFVHAQERYFEMDLMRRAAAGELSELVGSAALPMDKQRRPFRMRSRAAQALAAAAPEESSAMAAYVGGVNAGLNALGSRPWEYWLLRVAPKPWTAEDSVLVIDAMFFDLHDTTNARELGFAMIRSALPESVYKFISASGGPWDAPLLGPAMGYPALPPPADIDLSKLDPKLLHVPADKSEKPVPGSNSFAVNGALTTTQSALVANDMHLNLRVPNIWFRARLMYPNLRRAGEMIDLIGVTLPGVPTLVAGSNRHVAWAFTNSYGDWMDWVRVNLDAGDKTKYKNKSGMQPLQISHEAIKVHGSADETIDVRDTEWGPIIAEDTDGTPLALAWTALLPGALNLELAKLDVAETVDEAIVTANNAGIAPQNFVVGDRAGNIGWTIAGKIPRREGGYDPLLPSDWSQAGVGWNGWLTPQEYPHLPNPPGQRLWTANARTLDFESVDFKNLGDGGYDLGARTRQIRDDLKAKDHFSPDDALAIQLDDRALFMGNWHEMLVKTLAKAGDGAALADMKKYAADWDERADTASVGYRLARTFRTEVTDTILDGFAAAVRAKFADFKMPHLAQAEVLVDALLLQRPAHLLPPGYATWDDLLQKCAERVAKKLGDMPGGIAARTWGESNTAKIKHPLSGALPGLSKLLDMPADQLAGDSNMPHVAASGFGASERFAVEPGHEEYGYFHMPAGQSDNPLSPFYGAGHADWVKGRATPFLPGEAKYTLTLTSR
ncbi:MAG TPA: penicillin acylase family protein [Rudaea sp.]|nr:penicillin acylase family protein [Rudaea sp.]